MYLPCSSVIASLKKKKVNEEREIKPVKIKKKLEIQEAFFVEVQGSCRMKEKRAVINKTTSK